MISEYQVYTTSTSLSSSDSNASSRRNSTDDISYPDQLHKVDGKKRNKITRGKSYSIDRGFESVTEEPLEKDEKDEQEKKVLPHLELVNDFQEFRQDMSRAATDRKKRTRTPKKTNQYRRRSCTPTNRGLPRVEEETNKEDEELRNQFVFKLGLMLDKNEFNKKYSRASKSIFLQKEKKETSYNNQPIEEDVSENIKEKSELTQIHNQFQKLVVDEIDTTNVQEKKWITETPEVIPIPEEKAEEEINTQQQEFTKEAQQAIQQAQQLFSKQRDYVKKIVKGELISQDDQILSQLCSESGEYDWKSQIQEAEAGSSADSDEDKKQ